MIWDAKTIEFISSCFALSLCKSHFCAQPGPALAASVPFVMGETKPWAITERRIHQRFIQQQNVFFFICCFLGFFFLSVVLFFVSFWIIPNVHFTSLASSQLSSSRLGSLLQAAIADLKPCSCTLACTTFVFLGIYNIELQHAVDLPKHHTSQPPELFKTTSAFS